MDKNSPFGPMQKGLARSESRKVVGFPGKQWREERMSIKSSTDPIDVAISEDPKSLHREVDRRIDAKGGEGRKSTFDRAMNFLGL